MNVGESHFPPNPLRWFSSTLLSVRVDMQLNYASNLHFCEIPAETQKAHVDTTLQQQRHCM
jgi:hypothetical protein